MHVHWLCEKWCNVQKCACGSSQTSQVVRHFILKHYISTAGKHLTGDEDLASAAIWQEAVIGAEKYADVEQTKHEWRNVWRRRECEKAAAWIMARATSQFWAKTFCWMRNTKTESKVSSRDGRSAWARMKILYLHYCAIYPPQVVLQRDTKRTSLLQVRLSAMLHFSPHLQFAKDLKLPGKTTKWADVTFSRCHISNKFDFALLKIYFWTPDHIPYFFLALFYISFTRRHPGGDASIKKDKLQTQY